MVPKNASVIMPEFMLAYTGPDQTVHGYHQITYQNEFQGSFTVTDDYVIIDDRIPPGTQKGLPATGDDHVTRYYSSIADVAQLVSTSPDFERVYSNNDIELYVRQGS